MDLPAPDPGILKKIARAFLSGMLDKGDRILVGLSGGKDSLTLTAHLAHLQRHFQIPFEFEALHVRADFAGCGTPPGFLSWVENWGIKTHVLPVAIQGRLKPGEKLNCWWCSTQRRTELLQFARSHGFSKVALGHHLDDIVETLLMNMAFKSRISGMLPVMRYDHYDAVIIRPLAYVGVEQILRYAQDRGFLHQAETCPFGKNSLRLKAREALRILSQSAPHVRENLLRSMNSIDRRYLNFDNS